MIILIAAVSDNGVIGDGNKLPWNLPADLSYFKAATTAKTVLMGRKTYQSIIDMNGKPLPNRTSIVLTTSYELVPRGQDISITKVGNESVIFVRKIENLHHFFNRDLFVIGGASIYKEFIHKADYIYLTNVHGNFEGDTHFPDFDYREFFEVSTEFREADENNEYDMTFRKYKRLT